MVKLPYYTPQTLEDARRRLQRLILIALGCGVLVAGFLYATRIARHYGEPEALGAPVFVQPTSRAMHGLFGAAVVLLTVPLIVLGARRAAILIPLAPTLAVLILVLTLSGGALYGPHQAVAWWRAYAHDLDYRAMHAQALLFAAAASLPVILPVLILTGIHRRRLPRHADTHGSARHARLDEVRRHPSLAVAPSHPRGIVLGRLAAGGELVADVTDRHVLWVAPTGSGKTTAGVTPTLLGWEGPAVVLDVKGELYQLTAGHRQRRFGQRCIKLEFDAPPGQTHRLNPLAAIPRDKTAIRWANQIAGALTVSSGRVHGDPIWSDSTRQLLAAAIVYTLDFGPQASLGDVRTFISHPDQEAILEEIASHVPDPINAPHQPSAFLQTAANQLLALHEKTRTSVFFGAHTALNELGDPQIDHLLSGNDFQLSELLDARNPSTLYLVVAPDRFKTLSRLIRALLQTLIATIVAGGPRSHAAPPLLLALDELPVLGRAAFLSESLAYLRGYGVRVLGSVQSLDQLKETYGAHQTLGQHFGVQMAFTPSDLATAEVLSRTIGSFTLERPQLARSTPSGLLGKQGASVNRSVAASARRLWTADELRLLPRDQVIALVPGLRPALMQAAFYFKSRHQLALTELPPPTIETAAETGARPVGEAPSERHEAVPSDFDLGDL